MATETYELQAEPRTITGKKVRTLRADGKVPAVLYGHNVTPSLLSLSKGELEKVYRKAGGSSVVTVKMAEGKQNALIHDIHLHPTTGAHLHVDLYQVRMDEKIKAVVPLEFTGEASAVRELDGILLTNLTELEVECLPGDLPQHIDVSVDGLDSFEASLTVADLKVPTAVTVLTDPETAVASVTPPRTQEEVDEAAEDTELDVDAVESADDEKAAEGEEGAEEAGGEGSGDGAGADKAGSSDAKPEKG